MARELQTHQILIVHGNTKENLVHAFLDIYVNRIAYENSCFATIIN